MRKTVPEIFARKNGDKIVVLTAYSAGFAKILDEFCDILLVGDSVGMVVYGMSSTLPVSLEMMINHGKAVVNASKNALVVVDMNFGSYQKSPQQAYENAARIIAETGCQAIKLEGGAEMAETIEFLAKRAIPVMAHIGLKPQFVNVMGGYKVQGKSAATQLLADAKAVEKAGAFAIVLEGIKKEIADKITRAVKIPTIGIGASVNCDGQVLVAEDMLGLTENTAKFVKKYADLQAEIKKAAGKFANEVRSKKFPAADNCY